MNVLQRMIAKLFGIKTVDGILSASKKQISELKDVSEQLEKRAETKVTESKDNLERSTLAYQEALKKAQEKVEKDKEISLLLEKESKADVLEAKRAILISKKLEEVYEITAEELEIEFNKTEGEK